MTPRRLLLLGFLLAACQVLIACRTGASSPPRPKTPKVRAVEAELDPSKWFEAEVAVLRQAGAGPAEIVAVEAGAMGDRVFGMLEVAERTCVVIIARGTSTIEDLDLFVYADDGTSFGSDEAPDALPTLIVCPRQARTLYVAARIAQGHGLVAIGAQGVPPKSADKVKEALGNKADRAPEGWPGLEQQLAIHRQVIGGDWEDVRRVPLPVDARVPTALSAEVPPNGCLDVLALPAAEVSHLEILAKDSEGRIVGRGRAVGTERSLVLCSKHPARVTLEVRPHAGRGVAVVVLSHSLEGTALDIDADAMRFDLTTRDIPGDSPHRAARRRLDAAGYGAARKVADAMLGVGRRQSFRLTLPKGCVRLDLFAEHPMHGARAWFWDDQGQLAAEAAGGAQTTLFVCGTGREGRLDLEASVTPGRVAVEMRAESETAPGLLAHPLAASRLLSRMSERGVILSARQLGGVRAVALVPERLERIPLLVPVGRCVDLTLALGAGALGVELRVVDQGSGSELIRRRGPASTSGRVCALERPDTLHALAEIRVSGGAATALLATRMLAPKR